MVSKASEEDRTSSSARRCSVVSSVSRISSTNPRTAFIGVRISWLMFARNAARALGEIARVAERGLDLPALGHVLIHHNEPAAHDLGHGGGAQCEGDAASILATALQDRKSVV